MQLSIFRECWCQGESGDHNDWRNQTRTQILFRPNNYFIQRIKWQKLSDIICNFQIFPSLLGRCNRNGLVWGQTYLRRSCITWGCRLAAESLHEGDLDLILATPHKQIKPFKIRRLKLVAWTRGPQKERGVRCLMQTQYDASKILQLNGGGAFLYMMCRCGAKTAFGCSDKESDVTGMLRYRSMGL